MVAGRCHQPAGGVVQALLDDGVVGDDHGGGAHRWSSCASVVSLAALSGAERVVRRILSGVRAGPGGSGRRRVAGRRLVDGTSARGRRRREELSSDPSAAGPSAVAPALEAVEAGGAGRRGDLDDAGAAGAARPGAGVVDAAQADQGAHQRRRRQRHHEHLDDLHEAAARPGWSP